EGDQDHNVDGWRFERTRTRKFVFFDSHRALAQTPSAPDTRPIRAIRRSVMGRSMISNRRLSPSLPYISSEATSNRHPLRRSSLVSSCERGGGVGQAGESSGRRTWHNSHSEGLFDLNQYSNAGGGCRL